MESLEVEGYGTWRLDDTLPYFAAHANVSLIRLIGESRLLTSDHRGMQTVWVMGNETELLDKVPRPEVEGYLTFGGNVYGNATHWPEVIQYSDEWAEEQ